MKFDTSKCQEYFRDRYTGSSHIPFKDFKGGKKIYGDQLNNSDVEAYKNGIVEDRKNFYYKAVLCYCEGLAAITRRNLTWATIKLYYSVYFSLRCALLCRNIIILRANRNLFYVRVKPNESYEKPNEPTDHGGTIDTYVQLYNFSDTLCSNEINGKNVYKWMQEAREIVNYRDAVFHDPETPELWIKIIELIEETSLKDTLKLFNDDVIHCFVEDEAVLAIPTQVIGLVTKDIKNEERYTLSEDQKVWLKTIFDSFPMEMEDEIFS